MWRAAKRGVKRHNEALVLLGLILAIASFTYSIYSGQVADEYHRVQISLGLAQAHQANALHNGVGSSVVELPNGNFSNADTAGFSYSMGLTPSISIGVTCGNGTTFVTTGPVTCKS